MGTEHERLKEILAEAANRETVPERAEYVDAACGGNAELRAQVEILLQAHDQAGEFLEGTVVSSDEKLPEEGPGTIVGRYKLLQEIGEGGFGRVFMAEQIEPLRRRVALKIVKAGMDTREVVARFEAERQALALMDHPNIARMLDVGATLTGRPYFVMELVKGISITDYCDQHHLSPAGRLQLFLKVCRAVQHAHQKGVIHRDLKPSNVVVTEHDGEAVPKVIDFGVAKAIGQRLTDKTLFTRFEQMIGTPAYMSPEQAGLGSLDLDTRTDIYALGVLLYELLTGTTPVRRETLHQAALEEIRRVIRETDPPKPSTRLHTLGAKLTEVAQQRHTEPSALQRLVRGDLDWIVMKCLEKDRRRRYDTADALAQDLERHLNHEPVNASPPSRAYRTSKFIRRHRMGAGMTVAVSAALVLGLAASLIGFARASRARDNALAAEGAAVASRLEAEREAEKARTLLALVQEMLSSPGGIGVRGKDFRVDQMLDEFGSTLADKLKNQPELEAEVEKILGSAYGELGLRQAARAHLERALELERRLYGNQHLKVATTLWKLAGHCELQEQERIVNEGIAIWRRLAPQSHGLCDLLCGHASICRLQGRMDEAQRDLAEALRLAQTLEQDRVPALISVCFHRSRYEAFRGDLDAEEGLLRQALELSSAHFGPRRGWTPSVRRMLGDVLFRKGQAARAESYWREDLAFQRWAYGEAAALDALRSLRMVLRALGKQEPEIENGVFQAAISEAGSAEQAALVYKLRLGTPGLYQFYLRWDSHDMFSDSVYAQIQELQDGPGGEIADVYGCVIPMYPGDADFATLPAWQGVADREELNEGIPDIPAVWRIPAPGDYTLRLSLGEDGVALDALVLQLANLPPPEGVGPPESEIVGEGVHLERKGRVVVEAESFTSRIAGKMSHWVSVPQEHVGHVAHLHYRGSGYVQCLPDNTAENPAGLFHNRGFACAEVGDYAKAAEHYLRAIQTSTGNERWLFELALAQAASGQTEAYCETVRQMVRRVEWAGTNASPGLVPWFCALAPDAVPDYAYLLESAARPVAIEPVTGQGIIRLTQLGALLYRTQHYPEAIQQLTEAHTAWENATPKPNGWSPAYATLFLAMAHQQMGHPDEATRWVQRGLDLEAAESRSPHTGMPLPWHRRLSVAWLYREAQALLGAAQTADHPAVDQSAPTTP